MMVCLASIMLNEGLLSLTSLRLNDYDGLFGRLNADPNLVKLI